MFSIANTNERRAMAWATLIGGALLSLYWVAFVTGALDMGQDDPVIRAFESAFPVADALFCGVLFAASRALFVGRPSASFLLAWAGAISLYLGLLDLTFYAGRGHYSELSAVPALELALNLTCVVGGAAALLAAWRLRVSRGRDSRPVRRVAGRVVLVTGAASGIGAATAKRLAEAGASLALADIRAETVERLRERLTRQGATAIAFPVDVACYDSVVDLVEAVLMAFGRLDALVNCAGVLHPGAPDQVPVDSLRQQVETNLLGTIHTTRALLPHFRRRRDGHLLHVASLGGIVPLPGEAAYSATKFAVRGFCHSLALELRGTPIRVSVVNPDSTDTPQLRLEAQHDGSSLSFTSRPLAADDVARAIVRTLECPRVEVSVPALRGSLARLGAATPALLTLLYPVLDRRGRRGRARFRSRIRARYATRLRPLVKGT